MRQRAQGLQQRACHRSPPRRRCRPARAASSQAGATQRHGRAGAGALRQPRTRPEPLLQATHRCRPVSAAAVRLLDLHMSHQQKVSTPSRRRPGSERRGPDWPRRRSGPLQTGSPSNSARLGSQQRPRARGATGTPPCQQTSSRPATAGQRSAGAKRTLRRGRKQRRGGRRRGLCRHMQGATQVGSTSRHRKRCGRVVTVRACLRRGPAHEEDGGSWALIAANTPHKCSPGTA